VLPNSTKTVLITGTSSGIGFETALKLDELGYKVLATVRKEIDGEKLKEKASKNLQIILLDVSKADQIENLPIQIKPLLEENGLYALINNAGFNYVSPFEFTDQKLSRNMMEVNFFGAVYLAQAMIPSLRKYSQQTGEKSRVINISSIGGAIALPWESFYHASKFALLGISESLKFELFDQNITVSAVMPGGIRTPFFDKSDQVARQTLSNLPETGKQRYQKNIEQMSKAVQAIYPLTTKTEVVANRIAKILRVKNPKFKYLVGIDAKLIFVMTKFLPDWIRHGILQRFVSIK